MRVTEKRIQGDQTGAGTFAVEVLTTVLLNVFAWLTYFSFLRIDLFKFVGTGSSGAAITLLCIFLIPLAAALLTRIPKYGENQLYFWLIPELGLFLTTVFSNSAKGLTTWWKSIFPAPQTGQLMPFSDHSVATTLMFLAICLLTSAVIADDLCVHRRGVPLLSTLVPILFFVFAKVALPTDIGGYLYRWYFAIYLAILIFAMIFSIGKEKPRAFWKKRINMGISVMLISAIILAAVVGIYQNKNPKFVEDMQNKAPSSTMDSKTKKNMKQAGLPQGDIRKATEHPDETYFYILISSNHNLTRPVYLRSYTGEAYEKGKWVSQNKRVDSEVMKKILPAVSAGQFAGSKAYATLTIQYLYQDSSKKDKKNSKPQLEKPTYIMTTYDTVYAPGKKNNNYNFEQYAKVKLPGDFSNSVFKPGKKAGKEYKYKIDIANVDPSSNVIQGNVSEEYQSVENEYHQFVLNQYTNPKNFSSSEQDVLNFYEKHLGWSPKKGSLLPEAKQDVQQFLSRNFRIVNRTVETDHTKEDPFEYLLETSKGKDGRYVINQIHLASLETLLLRSEGVPARYVEGYMFDPASQKKQKDGKYRLDNKNTHVWSEVYVQHKGWVPVELGPAQNSSSKDEPKKIRRGSGGNQNAKVKSNPRTKKAARKSQSQTWLTVLLSILLAAIAITALVFAALAIRNKRMLRKLEESSGPENTFRGYRILLRNLRKKRYPASARYPERLLPYLGEEYRKYLGYVYEERYSPNGLNAEERRFCTDFVLSTIQNTQKLPKEDRT